MSKPTTEPTTPGDVPADLAPGVTDRELLAAATMARERAYVPYSGFAMGAAVRTHSGQVVPGALIENVSLGLAMCAERVALFAAATADEVPVRLVLIAERTNAQVTRPCGACLQVALELGGPDVEIVAATPDGEVEIATVGELLPCGPHKPRSGGR
jgi:cytidine deaminase